MEVLKFRSRAGWLVFAFCLIIYLVTLCPTVYWDDAGELIAASYTLGIPHPPGHPLYALLGKLFTLLPMASIAWRVNFLSAFFGALTCLLVYKIIIELVEVDNVWVLPSAWGGACFFGFAPIVWDQATIAETSTLHSFFMMMLVLLAVRLTSGKVLFKSESKSLYLFAFLYGLSLTNHVAGVFFLPAFIYLFLKAYGRRMFSPRVIGGMSLFFFCGLVVYAYLPIRSFFDPPIDWGNPETVPNFLWVITARQYTEGLISKPEPVNIASYIGERIKDLPHQFSILGCVFAVVGLFFLYRKKRDFLVFSLLVIGVLFCIGLNSAFISAYFIPAIALMAVWIGAGIWQLLKLVTQYSQRISAASFLRVMRLPLYGLISVAFVIPLAANFRDMDRSTSYYALRYGENILQKLPESSMLFTTKADTAFILWYLMYCENRRNDLIILPSMWLLGSEPLISQISEQYPEVVFPSSKTVAEYISRDDNKGSRKFLLIQSVMDANYGKHPVFWGTLTSDVPFTPNLVPIGVLFRYSAQPVSLDDETLSENRSFWEAEMNFLAHEPNMTKDKISLEIYPVELNNQGLMFEQKGRDDLARWATDLALKFNPDFSTARYNLGRLKARQGDYKEAVKQYQCALNSDPHMAAAYYNLGNAYANLHRYDEAFIAYRTAAQNRESYYEALTAMGRLYLMIGHNEDAEQKFLEALEIEPSYIFAIRGLASVYLDMNRLDEAKQAVDKALQMDPKSASALLTLAKYYARTGNEDGAVDAMERAIEFGGDSYLEEIRADTHLRKLAEGMSIGGKQT